MDKTALEEKIIEQIKQIYDPEIPVNIYDIGLIYEIRIEENGKVYILMTLTTPNCPVAESLPAEVRQKISEVEGVGEVDLDLTFDPAWTQDMLTEEAKLELGLI